MAAAEKERKSMLEGLLEKESVLIKRLDNLEGCEDNPVYKEQIKEIRNELSEIQSNIKTELLGREERTVTLTNADWSSLTCYILMTTKHREGELESWRNLAQEKDKDGKVKFSNAENNVTFWEGMIKDINRIRTTIDGVQL